MVLGGLVGVGKVPSFSSNLQEKTRKSLYRSVLLASSAGDVLWEVSFFIQAGEVEEPLESVQNS